MTLELVSLSAKNTANSASSQRNLTPENRSVSEAVEPETDQNAQAATTQAALSSSSTAEENPHTFPTFRHALDAQTMQTLFKMYAR